MSAQEVVNTALRFSRGGAHRTLIGSAGLNVDQFLAIAPAGISESQIKGEAA
ncbi:MAG: hypothetical protein WBF06_01985 [Candidatus Acidiferrales bacterium]